MIEYIRSIRKALVPVAVAGVLSLLAAAGINEDMTVGEAVTYVVTSLAVYLVPNKK